MYPKLSKATIYHHTKKLAADKTFDNRKDIHGRPRKISPQEMHLFAKYPFLKSSMGLLP